MAAQKQTTQQNVFKPVEEAVSAGQAQLESVVKAGSEAAANQYEQTASLAREQFEKTSTALFKGCDEVTTLNKANVDAVVKASTVLGKGFESLGRELMDFAQAQFETSVETSRKLFAAKSVNELLGLQTEYARASLDTLLTESAKVTEMGVKVANEALAPIQTQTSATVEKAMKAAA